MVVRTAMRVQWYACSNRANDECCDPRCFGLCVGECEQAFLEAAWGDMTGAGLSILIHSHIPVMHIIRCVSAPLLS